MKTENLNKLLILILIILSYMYFTKKNCQKIIEGNINPNYPSSWGSFKRRVGIIGYVKDDHKSMVDDGDDGDNTNMIIDNPRHVGLSKDMLGCLQNIEMNACEVNKNNRMIKESAEKARIAEEQRLKNVAAKDAQRRQQDADAAKRLAKIREARKNREKKAREKANAIARAKAASCPRNPKDSRGRWMWMRSNRRARHGDGRYADGSRTWGNCICDGGRKRNNHRHPTTRRPITRCYRSSASCPTNPKDSQGRWKWMLNHSKATTTHTWGNCKCDRGRKRDSYRNRQGKAISRCRG